MNTQVEIKYPKITIVTPVFNQVRYIERTIKSIVDQNYPNLEYIIVDGGSTDGTLEIINNYSKKITKIISEPDKGMYYALEKGLNCSSGEIMAWLNADDLYHYNSFFIVAEIFEKFKEIELLMGRSTTFDEFDRCVHIGEIRKWSKYDFFIAKNNWPIQQESTFWRRSLWDKSGSRMDKDYKLAADCALWTRFLTTSNADLHIVNALLGGFRLRKNQLSENKELYHKEVARIWQNTPQPENVVKTLKKISFYKKFLTKIPVLRFLFHWDQAYINLYNYPPLIKYDFKKKEFVKMQ
jgi:glycosyltransferase involved in cell wall biosynthesis